MRKILLSTSLSVGLTDGVTSCWRVGTRNIIKTRGKKCARNHWDRLCTQVECRKKNNFDALESVTLAVTFRQKENFLWSRYTLIFKYICIIIFTMTIARRLCWSQCTERRVECHGSRGGGFPYRLKESRRSGMCPYSSTNSCYHVSFCN